MMMHVFCIQLLAESVIIPNETAGAQFGFYRNEYVLTSSQERAIVVAKERTMKKLAKISIVPVPGLPFYLEADDVTPNMPLSRVFRNEGFCFFRTDLETSEED
ncbi:hypothetical protein LP419_21790 [Massilia sp. H-1]|nr:hypothetical protein LP419_21790 [Massilia sp. H-1]